MRYELLNGSDRGVLIDRTPIMRDVKDTFEVSFLLPADGAFVALFKGEDNAEYKTPLRDSVAKLPKELLGKEQYVGLIVSEVDNERVVRSWECEALRVTAFLNLRQTRWQLSGGMTEKACLDRLAELERVHSQTLAELASLKAATSQHRNTTAELVAQFRLELYEQREALASLKNEHATITAATKALNDNQAILQSNIKRLSATVESLK